MTFYPKPEKETQRKNNAIDMGSKIAQWFLWVAIIVMIMFAASFIYENYPQWKN